METLQGKMNKYWKSYIAHNRLPLEPDQLAEVV